MPVKITKRKAPEGDGWQIVVNGKPTALRIGKGPPPRYREPQMYDVFLAGESPSADDYLFETKGVAEAESILAKLAEPLAQS